MRFAPSKASERVAARYVPVGAVEQKHDDAGAVIYLFGNKSGDPSVLAYVGTAYRPAINFRFKSVEARDAFVTKWVGEQRAAQARRAERQAERKNATHELVEGDIVYTCWGYEQTNVDFYQVVRVVSPKTVQVRQVSKSTTETGFMSGSTVPNKDQFIADAPILSRRAQGTRVLNIDHDHGGPKWDGRPVSCSWGH